MNRYVASLPVILLACLLPAAPGALAAPDAFVSIAPLAYFAQQLSATGWTIHVLVPPDASPATYDPTPQQLVQLSESQLLFTVGVPFERTFLPAVRENAPQLTIVNTASEIEHHELQAHAHPGHHHDHGPSSLDPHVWLDPWRAITLAETMAAAYIQQDATHAKHYRQQLDVLRQELTRLDRDLQQTLAPVNGKSFYIFHPALGYFAQRYGLHQVPVEVEGKEPSPRQLANFIEQARRDQIRAILVQPQFSRRTASILARELNASIVTVDPLARDYPANMRAMAQSIRNALAP